jgi:hypothetical protein
VLGGMITATFLAIFFIPLFYVVVVQFFGSRQAVPSEDTHSENTEILEGE